MLEIIPIDTPTLGDRSYLVHDGQDAFVIDPQLDIDRVLALAADRGVRVRHVFETHIHNDYVTGGRALADATGARYHVNAADPVSFERDAISDGDVVEVSPTLSVRAVATPGHTFTHLSFVLLLDGRETGVFTGGSLLFGSTGRPDLLGPDATDALVRAQYRSAHRLAAELPEAADVFPTHGFGSFCSATQTEGTSSTIGQEKRSNPALTQSEHDYVEQLLAGLDAFPAYYAHMGPANLAAPAQAPDLSLPRVVDAAELRERIEAGEWVVDLRSRTAFAAGHAPGTLNFGLDGSFATYLGWMVPWGTPITLLGESAEQVAEAQRELVRIGIDRPAAAATGGPEQWSDLPLGTMARATFADLRSARTERHVTVLDVRRDLEWAQSHLVGAVHVPLHELVVRLDEVPAGEVWVHCQGGYRASLAASFLHAQGRQVVAVDDEFANAEKAGLPLEVPSEVAA
jgi:glyoxylase-like metal-dependent hydrolase (beta-lactamase superfamily II)/rhodanese-related sulfurtransferase